MKKILVFSIVFILLIGIVSSSALSTLWKQGVSAANPQAAKVIGMADQIMEVQSLAQCATGVGASACMQSIVEQKAMGQVYGEAIKAAGPEVQKIISTYQQIDLYREAGAELIDLKIDEGGEIKGGTIQFSGEKESEIGNLIGKDLKKEDISVKNSKVEIFNEKERENSLSVARITFNKKGASAKIGVNDFSGIMSQEETGKPAYVELDKDGNIVKANFMTGKEGGTFIFGGVKFDTPPNSNVFYDADNGELKLEKGSEIKEFSDFEKGKGIRIFGNDVKITNDIFLKYGRIRITKRGYFINGYGGVIYKQIFVRDFSKQGVLIANPSIDLSNEDINYIRQTDNTLELKSCSDLNCDLNAEILENNEILNTDYNDKLVFHVAKGDSLIINKGLNGKPPKILRKGDWHGFSLIRNDGIGFNIDDRGMSMWDNFFTYEDLEKGRFQSVAFEMEFDSDEMINNKLIIDSSSKFSMISRNGEERVVFEKQGIPKSLLNMNQEQTNNLINNLDKASPQMRELVESNIDVALREYDGENFEEIEQGVKITSKYAKRSIYNSGLSNLVGVAKKGGFKFTKIKNKEDLIQEYTASLNSYFEYPESLNNYEISKIAVTINKLHDNEGLIDGTDNMREQIARDLSFKAKYNLIAISNADLYQSTFDKLYNNFPKDSIKEIKGIDPNGEYWADFAIQIGERDKLNDLLKQDPGFLVDAVDKGISISDPRKVEESTASLANTFIEFYENPEYSDEKKYFEERLVRLYENTDTLDKKASYSYLIKLNEQSSNPEFKNIYNSLPELPDVSVPKCSGDVCTGKQYFYSDENWFDITLNDYTNKEGIYQFDIIKKTDDTAILEKNLQNGKTMRMILTTDNSDASEVLKDDETIFVGHRGHSYNSKETFKGSSDKKKIIFDGGCGGPGRVVEIQKQYPNAQVIYDKNTGEGAVNQYEAYKILRRVTLGETEWNKIRDNTEDKKGIILPNEKNQLMIRYKTLVKRDIERQEDSRYASR